MINKQSIPFPMHNLITQIYEPVYRPGIGDTIREETAGIRAKRTVAMRRAEQCKQYRTAEHCRQSNIVQPTRPFTFHVARHLQLQSVIRLIIHIPPYCDMPCCTINR